MTSTAASSSGSSSPTMFLAMTSFGSLPPKASSFGGYDVNCCFGKKKFAKQIIESVNEDNNMIVFKVIEGDPLDLGYKSFTITLHVETKGDGQVATWTFDFEKLDTSAPYPTSLMDYLCNLVKDLDAHNNAK
ncbi:hypothetical protein QVD17_21062 [Tagetes erecta]|uniref:Bet v I/Major latex protein domain-containing protein n=1 Tax=Tagetes erecta TaxID=13708 RepID=A0AAD8KMP2_TARER|nr:hypothetical protein QVD17_21062 [Tagetes erecta]